MKIKVAIMMMAMVFGTAKADTMTWQYSNDLSSSLGSVDAGWLVQLYRDVSKDTNLSLATFDTVLANGLFTSAGNASDDVLSITTTVADAGGGFMYWYDTPSSPGDNWNVYSVVFNSSSIATATMGIIIDSTPFTTPTGTPFVYDNSSASGSWQAVPEPATALLFGIGGLGTWIVRRKKVIG